VKTRIEQIGESRLTDYASIPLTFKVKSVFRITPTDGGLGGLAFHEEEVTPYEKDCNVDGQSGPESWPQRFDIRPWGIFLAFCGSEHVGGVAVATPHQGVIATEGRTDTAALWDIRVAPARRHQGIGTELLHHATDWARRQGYRFLGIETMNVNVPACRLYAKAGAELSELRRFGYEGCPAVAHEAMLIWRMKL
jgi:GNAT superfamily N-acetyltransferase